MSHRETVFVVGGRPTATNTALVDAFRRLGVGAEWLHPRALAAVRAGDTVLARLDVRATLDGPEPGLAALARLERRGVDVLNPSEALLAAHDKLRTALALARFGVPHPRTWHVGAGTVPAVPLPAVVKPRFGSWGRDVELCRDAAELSRCLRRLRRRRWFRCHGALVQELVPPLGRDLRVVVAAGEAVGAVERLSRNGEWRTNVTLGAVRRRAAPPPDAVAAALAAAAAIGADLAGVDLLPLPDGWTVLEVNGAVDFTPAYSHGGRDVFDAVACLLAAARPLAPAVPAVALA